MPWSKAHINWLVDSGIRFQTADGKEVEVWEFNHEADDIILSSWAKHFRNHYCLDCDIDFLSEGLPRAQYLEKIKFPSKNSQLGPGIRAGDFGEILVADYLEWILGYWVPRVRWASKVVRDESPKGSDVIGFHFENKDNKASPNDVLVVFESKTKFSKSKVNRLQTAINDSAKDHLRVGESLNFIKQKLYDKRELEQAKSIGRFQNPVDVPYKEIFGAAAIISNELYDEQDIAVCDCNCIPKSTKSDEVFPHPNRDNLKIIVFKGPNMMDLVHELYRRAADEA